ncbi:MAG: ABC transporter ATP-binding protein [Chloroflexi bacterium]|nr:ABC transporter ATP-binding protein [Chloroflexota bacterium]
MTSAQASPATIVEAKGLTKAYGRTYALQDVSFSVTQGERVVLLGANGAGKTTLLRLLAGLLRPTEGSVLLWGTPPWHARCRAQVGVTSHASYHYEELTAWENLRLFGRLYGASNLETAIERALERVGLAAQAREPVRTLSRGMQQRLAIARATLHRPALLLLDEPETGLDAAAQGDLATFLFPNGEETAVIATHSLSLGLTLGRRWVILSGGRVQYDSQTDGEDQARVEKNYQMYVVHGGR